MKIEFLTSLFLIATSLSARMAIQRIEQALLATVAEHGAIGMTPGENSRPGVARFGRQARSQRPGRNSFAENEPEIRATRIN
jgi:hypothetical protein